MLLRGRCRAGNSRSRLHFSVASTLQPIQPYSPLYLQRGRDSLCGKALYSWGDLSDEIINTNFYFSF